VEVSLDSSHSWPNGIQFNRDTLRIRGIAPIMEEDKAYDLTLHARTNASGESLLHVYQTITSTSEKLPLQSLPVRPTLPSAGAQQRRDPDVQPQPSTQTPPGPPSAGTSHENNCLLKILRGESCEPDRYRGDSQ
jgi:hypothetical protein